MHTCIQTKKKLNGLHNKKLADECLYWNVILIAICYIIYMYNTITLYIYTDSVVHDTCSGYTNRLPSRFGVIKSPGYPQNPNGNPNGCVWRIPLGLGQRIDVTVHLAYSREKTEGNTCSAKFLHVRYVDCRSLTTVTEYFCQTHEVNISRQSCGDVTIQSYSYFKGDDRGNRFLVSYEGRILILCDSGSRIIWNLFVKEAL